MDLYRAFLAVILSFLVLMGYQYFFVTPPPPQPAGQAVQSGDSDTREAPGSDAEPAQPSFTAPRTPAMTPAVAGEPPPPARDPKDSIIDTPLYTAVITEYGGALKSFVLKNYREDADKDSPGLDLVKTASPADRPLLFAVDGLRKSSLPLYEADKRRLDVTGSPATLTLRAQLPDGIELIRTLTFSPENYNITLAQTVINRGEQTLQASPTLSITNQPFSKATAAGRFLFHGPVVLMGEDLEETKIKKLEDGPQALQGQVTWAAYEDTYFICAVIPEQPGIRQITMSASGDMVRTEMAEGIRPIAANEQGSYSYSIYMGPKKLSILNEVGHDLGRAVNLGWFEPLAKPMLYLLNKIHSVIGNYGIAIILLTVLIKAVFWPLSQKGMKSMKNMQKVQPKVTKLREKYKDDPKRMNQEMMQLYKTYKVNPLGGCMPMLLQIPVFFALYKILLQAIELRHAPFMLWITDLSAPDRLFIGFDIPFLGGIPVLTLLMGASMYLQQKMTPTTADPTQARIMAMLPIIFTFMFLNFASGLVLYWFVNNLLSILQQQMINKQTSKS